LIVDNQGEKIIFDLKKLIPSYWFKDLTNSSIWVTCYSMYEISKEDIRDYPKILDFENVRAIILFGEVSYLNYSDFIPQIINSRIHFDKSKIRKEKTPIGTYLLVLTPFDIDGKEGNVNQTKIEISIVAGLLGSFNGRNMIFEKIFENIYKGGQISFYSHVFENPSWFAKPDISNSRLEIISKANKTISSLPEHERNRVCLSLRWFEQALFDNGVNAFLKYWIALETISMPNTTNIQPLVEILSRAYNLSYEVAKESFAIGKLFGLRARIVHGGHIISIHAQLIRYMEALYSDILQTHLGLSCEQRAMNILKGADFRIREYLHEH